MEWITRLFAVLIIVLLCACSADVGSMTYQQGKDLDSMCDHYGGTDFYQLYPYSSKKHWARCNNGVYTYNLKEPPK